MKLFLAVMAALCALSVNAQTNIEFTSISISPTPSNYNQITLAITNLSPGQEYALKIERRLTDGFSYYINFTAASNSTQIVRYTSADILVRFYRVEVADAQGIASLGFNGQSRWDSEDLPGDNSDLLNADGGTSGSGSPWDIFMMRSSRLLLSPIDPAILDLIMPPPLRPANRR